MSVIWKRLWARRYAPFLGGIFTSAFSRRNPYGFSRNKLFIPEGNLHACYFAKREFENIVRNYARFVRKQNLKRYAVRYEAYFKRFLKGAKQFARINYATLDNLELADLLERITAFYADYAEVQYLGFVILEGPGRQLEKALARYANQTEISQWVATLYKIPKITKARLELLRLVRDHKASASALRRYLKKYSWIPIYDFVDRPWTLKDIKAQVKAVKDAGAEIKQYRESRRKSLHRLHNFLRNLQSRKLKKLIEIVHTFSYLKDMRDDYRRQTYFLLRPFWQEVGKRLGVTFVQANYLLSEELVRLLSTGQKPSLKLISARQKTYSFSLIGGKLRIFAGDLTKQYLVQHGTQETSILKGTAAHPGIVRGPAKVIYHNGEFEKLRKGDILVTVMTHPEFLPIMKLAAAFVTDEGGITCHAAIVARELEKPCVIGTKIATKVLKDGDLVEVDADEGIVRKL